MRSPAMTLLFTVLRPPIGAWLRWRFRVSVHRHGTARALQPPYLLLSNHVNFWDPFLLAIVHRRPIHFLAADGNFRSRLMRRIMTWGGSIPKAKARTDIESLRLLQARITDGEVVALFPEGQRTWDGRSRSVLPATPKLARLLGAPVVVAQLRGAYLSTPRWSKRLRRGRLEIHVRQILSARQVRSLPRSEVARRIDDAIRFDEGRWQEQSGVRFPHPRRAEHAEQAFFWCPACGTWDTLRSGGAELHCIACDYTAWLGPSGRWYQRSTGTAALPRVFRAADLNRSQLAALTAGLARALGRETPHDVVAPLPVVIPAAEYRTGHRSRPLRRRGRVTVNLDSRVLSLSPGPRIPIKAISGIHVQFATQLEFYADGRLHVLRMGRPQDSAYRLEETVLRLQELYTNTQH